MENQEPDKEFPTMLRNEKVRLFLLVDTGFNFSSTLFSFYLRFNNFSILFLSRCGMENVDCKYYDKLEQVLGDEAFSMFVYDEDDKDAGL